MRTDRTSGTLANLGKLTKEVIIFAHANMDFAAFFMNQKAGRRCALWASKAMDRERGFTG